MSSPSVEYDLHEPAASPISDPAPGVGAAQSKSNCTPSRPGTEAAEPIEQATPSVEASLSVDNEGNPDAAEVPEDHGCDTPEKPVQPPPPDYIELYEFERLYPFCPHCIREEDGAEGRWKVTDGVGEKEGTNENSIDGHDERERWLVVWSPD